MMDASTGLIELYRPDKPTVEYANPTALIIRVLTFQSIVAVHGLNGHPVKTWTTEKSKKFWLKDADLLPSNLKSARILTFGYNAAVAALLGRTSSDRILQHAQTLIAELVADREVSPVVTRRNIIDRKS